MGVTAELHQPAPPPAPPKRKTLGHPPAAKRLHLGKRAHGRGVTLWGSWLVAGPLRLTRLFLFFQGLWQAGFPVSRYVWGSGILLFVSRESEKDFIEVTKLDRREESCLSQ